MTSRRDKKFLKANGEGGFAPGPVARNAGVALWRQIAQDLETEIVSAGLTPGDRLPTEAELSTRYAVNRHTLRRALGELTRKGLIEATPRLGTFVARSRLAYPISKDTRFSEIVAAAGHEPGGRLLSASECRPPPDIAAQLNLDADAGAIQLDLVRAANGVPICISTSWFPASRFANIGRLFSRTQSITRSLSMLGVTSYRRKVSRISARIANSEERSVLNLEPGSTVLVVDALNVDSAGSPVQWTRARFSADRVELVVES
jgi:GntR family transcriptional regulator, phosphonate transport system regulatory protein